MKKTVLFAVVIIATCLVVFPSCDNGSTSVSLTTADLEGIWVATGEAEGTAKAMLFEFSGNDFTRIAYTETPDSDDMIQDEGSKGTFSVSDDTLMMAIDGPVYFEKKSFSLPSALVNTWYEFSGVSTTDHTLVCNTDGTYSYNADTYTSEGTSSASPDLLRFITTYEVDDGTESTFYIENLYEYDITDATLTFSWDGTEFSKYSYAQTID